MTQKEKAKELVGKYYVFGIKKEGQSLSFEESKKCALIAVDEVIYCLDINQDNVYFYNSEYEYYKEVKQEIDKL